MDKYFERTIKYDDKLKNIFNLLTISGNYSVIGSASLKKIKYRNDYDLAETFKTDKNYKDQLYDLFLNKFKIIHDKLPSVFIVDFKCGADTTGPLRWSYDDIKKGFKIMDSGRQITFQECLMQKTMMKMDIIASIDGLLTEFSENYYIKLGDDSNFFKHDLEQGHILNEVKKSYHDYFDVHQNYFKALKRSFSYKLTLNKTKYKKELIKMIDFFNSDVGYLYKIKSELETMLILKESNFKPVPKKLYDINIHIIIKQLYDVGIDEKLNTDDATITRLIKEIDTEVQEQTLKFIKNNKKLLL